MGTRVAIVYGTQTGQCKMIAASWAKAWKSASGDQRDAAATPTISAAIPTDTPPPKRTATSPYRNDGAQELHELVTQHGLI